MVPTSQPQNASKKQVLELHSQNTVCLMLLLCLLHICMVLHVAKYMDDFGTQACHRNELRYFYGDASAQAMILFRVSQNTLHSILIQF